MSVVLLVALQHLRYTETMSNMSFFKTPPKETREKRVIRRNTKTFSISLSPKVFDMLVKMKEAEGATSLSSVISNAISIRYEQKEALKQWPSLVSVYNDMKKQQEASGGIAHND